jgi:hypothetical protein
MPAARRVTQEQYSDHRTCGNRLSDLIAFNPPALGSGPRVLLIGRNQVWPDTLLKSFQKFDSEIWFALPSEANTNTISQCEFDVVLLDSTVTRAHRQQLARALGGTNAHVFYVFPVETGSWWLPVLHAGQDCHGAPAFRRKEFQFEVERILQEHAGVVGASV